MKLSIEKAGKVRRTLLVIFLCIIPIFYILKIYTGVLEDREALGTNITTGIENSEGNIPIGGIYGDTLVSQSFLSTERGLSGFSIRFATYARINHCTLLVELVDTNKGCTIYSELVDGSTLLDNEYRDFSFKRLTDSKNHIYSINISSIGTSNDSAITLYKSSNDAYPDGELTINKKLCEGDIHFKVYFKAIESSLFRLLRNISFLVVVCSAIVLLAFYVDILLERFAKIIYLIITALLLLIAASLFISDIDGNSIYLTFNYRALIILGGISSLTIFSEKKLHYWKWVKGCALDKVETIKKIEEQHEALPLILHLFTILINFVVIIYFSVFSSCCWKSSCLLTLFTLCMIAIIANLFDQIFVLHKSPADIFIVVSLLLGLIMSYSFKPKASAVYDGSIHYENAAALRQLLFDRNYTVADWYMIAANYDRPEYIESIDSIEYLMLSNDQEVSSGHLRSLNPYNYIGYLPVATMMAFSDAIGADFLKMVVFSRLINSVLYSIVIYYGLRRMKSGIYLFSSLSLMPLMLFLSAQFTYDYWVNAFIIYGIAYLVSEMQTPEHIITVKDCIFMFGSIFLGCGPKPIYCVMLFLFLFLSRYKFKNERAYRWYMCACLATFLIILASFMIPFLLNPGAKSDMRGGADVNAKQQILFILTNPFDYAWILLKHMSSFMSLRTFMAWIGEFAYMGSGNPFFITVCTIIVGFCMFTDKNEYDKFQNITPLRLVICGISFVQVALICTALYISFTPVGLNTINGNQYRYVFPILFPLLYAVGSPKILNGISQRAMSLVVFGGMSLSTLGSVFSVYLIKVL